MVKLLLPYVVSDRDRHGNLRYYYRRKGVAKTRLRGLPGSREFMDGYNHALAGGEGIRTRSIKNPRSFESLCENYFKSADFVDLNISTTSWRCRALRQICIKNGEKPFAALSVGHVRRLVDELAELPGAARNRLKALKALFRWAIDQELLTANPTNGVRPIRYVSEGHHSWSPEEVLAFESHFPIGTKPRLAMALLLNTACRRGDVVRLGTPNFKSGRLKYRQNKNAKRSPVDIDIPVHADLARIIDATPTGPFTFLITEFGRPFTVAGFGNRFREWCDQAGLAGCSAHGLRKAAAIRLVEAGATSHEVMAVTGHKTLAEVERYTAAANRRNLADSAIARIK